MYYTRSTVRAAWQSNQYYGLSELSFGTFNLVSQSGSHCRITELFPLKKYLYFTNWIKRRKEYTVEGGRKEKKKGG